MGRQLSWAFAAAALTAGTTAQAQSIEPRAYSPAPTGVNFLVVGYSYTEGGLSFDTLPITDAKLSTEGAVVAYGRTLDLWGRAAKFDAILPYNHLAGSAIYNGAPISREIHGFHDPLVRVSINLFGAPALTPAEFRSHKQDVVVGASLQVSVPLGQYDDTRLINLGGNRWSIRPELGVSKTAGPWNFELAGGATFFTDNDDFFGGNQRTQKPLYSARGHVIYTLRPGAWISVDATYYAGARSTLNGTLSNDRLANWRVGATVAAPVNARSSIKLFASSGVSARTGNNFDLMGVAWQYRWGAGM